MPAILTIVSALYFVYVLLSEDTVLLADAVGGDPGGKVLPMAMAVFMFFGFLYITVKERPDGQALEPAVKRLFFITLGIAVLYVALIQTIGFIILSTLLLYSLEYIYTTVDKTRNLKQALYGGLGTVAGATLLYLIMRMITKNLMSLGRTGALPEIFQVSTFQASISLVYVGVIGIVCGKTIIKKLNEKGMNEISNASMIAVVTVLFLYVVFKQFFSVNLAVGIINY